MPWRRDRDVAVTIALVGVLFIFGGEAFCFFGPLGYENAVSLVCHTFLYSGIGLIAIAAAVHAWSERRRKRGSG